jgi:predicted hotdog family 3-hydroxylacyl-ACP dehydratase
MEQNNIKPLNFDLKNNMSHQPPMLLIDEILSESLDRGETLFVVKKDNIFLDEFGHLSRSAFIEIAAQSFAAIDLYQKSIKKENTSAGFLAAVRDFSFYADAKENDAIICKLHKFDELERLHFIKAQMYSDKGVLFAQGEIRIYELNGEELK